MTELKDQVIARLKQALVESNLDSISAQTNIALIQTLTNLLSILLAYENAQKT